MKKPFSGIVVELLERQAAGVEEVEDRLVDDLGETQEQRTVLLDRRLAGLDLQVLLLRKRRREKSVEEILEAVNRERVDPTPELSQEEYLEIEAGKSPIEKYGPLFLGFAEVIEQPVFNLFYPCGLPFQELDDYP